VGAAVAVHDRADSPGWPEKILVIGICASLLVALAIVDERAARNEAIRAHAVISERAQHAAERSSREAMTAPAATAIARTDHLGRDSPIVIAGGSGLGPAAAIVAEQEVAGDTGAPTPQNVLHRTQGPSVSGAASAIPEPVTEPARARPSAPPAASTAVALSGTRDDEPLLLALMAALGLSMAGGGLRLLSRRSA
jgi:hypothetical protein